MGKKLFLVILAIILPPAVVLAHGRLLDFVLSIALTLAFWISGIIHAFWVLDERHIFGKFGGFYGAFCNINIRS